MPTCNCKKGKVGNGPERGKKDIKRAKRTSASPSLSLRPSCLPPNLGQWDPLGSLATVIRPSQQGYCSASPTLLPTVADLPDFQFCPLNSGVVDLPDSRPSSIYPSSRTKHGCYHCKHLARAPQVNLVGSLLARQ